MEFKNQAIKCNIFWDTEAVIKKAEAKIEGATSAKERQYYAEDILLEAEALLSCSNYNATNRECLYCHAIIRRYLQRYENLAGIK